MNPAQNTMLVAGLLLICASCTKESSDPAFSTTPVLELVTQAPVQLTSFQDTLRLSLRYQDGDGDLGGFESGSALYVLDRRLSEPDVFQLGRLTPEGEALSTQGTLHVALGPYFVLGNAPSETFTLEVWITDRAGNESNRVFTPDLTVSP